MGPPTRPPSSPPSRAPSRAASVSSTRPHLSPQFSSPLRRFAKSKKDRPPPVTPVEQNTDDLPQGPPSADGGTKFSLRDLLGSSSRRTLSRKSSARSSASDRQSDSEGGPQSSGGESTGSLSQKYGTYKRDAIGKGATSVVRLTHKWDRDEEKLYAVKVIYFLIHCDSR
jgi:protein-serine/threonine kinase